MGEAKVCGTSEQARGLKTLMSQTMRKLDANITSMEQAVKSIHNAWDDDGVGEVDEILSSIRNALNNAKEAMPSVEKALEAYAEFLEEG